jgi:hypothetical protein
MKLFNWLILLILFLLLANFYSHNADIKSLLPQDEEIPGWERDEEFQIAEGDDLYILINGGAQIYHEYGFIQAVYQTYVDTAGNCINLEIYEMDNSSAAYGMYTFKTDTTGEPVDIGAEGWLSSYYLNFWKGPYVVTLIGLDTNENIKKGLIRIARILDDKIQVASQRPHLISYLPEENLKPNGLTYMQGNLALLNQYPFASKNILNCIEGIRGNYGTYSLFVLEYGVSEEAQLWYQSAQEFIATSDRYEGYQEQPDFFMARDTKKNTLFIKVHNKWIMIYIGSAEMDMKNLLNNVRTRLPR